MVSMSMSVIGDANLRAVLRGLPEKLERSVIRGGMRELAKVVAEEARENVPSTGITRQGKSGKVVIHADDVRGSIKVRSSVLRSGIITSSVYTSGKGSGVALWLEYGTVPHLVSVREDVLPTWKDRRGRVRAWSVGRVNKAVKRSSLVIGNRFVGAIVSHPGASPRPFLRPALDAKFNAGMDAMATYIQTRLAKYGLDAPVEPEATDE